MQKLSESQRAYLWEATSQYKDALPGSPADQYLASRGITDVPQFGLGYVSDPLPGVSEEWRPIPDWEGLYEISTRGRVKSLDREVRCEGRKPYIRKGRLMALQTDRYGHLYCDLTRNGKHHRRSVHVLVCTTWHGPKPSPELGALHRNGLHDDNRPENLYWGTWAQNHADAVAHGRYSRDKRGRLCSV